MQLVFHTGAHFTEEARLTKCLLNNKAMLKDHGVDVPDPKRYRKSFRDAFTELDGAVPFLDTHESLLDDILQRLRAEFGKRQISVRY